MALVIGPVECRVLGCLMEKEVTVPAAYPLSINGVVTACNQASGRDPVMTLDSSEVEAALDDLRTLGLTRRVHASHGGRVVKHRHVADEVLELDGAERSVVTLLLLRGAQTPGELRSRSERLHPFADVDEVVAVLDALARRGEPLVVAHDRRPGQKEQRWSHLLGGMPSEPVNSPSPTPAAAPAAPLPDSMQAVAGFVGRWVGEGHGSYPTIEPFDYTQEVNLAPVPGKPFLTYRSATRHRDDGRPLHAESGFLRVAGPDNDQIELVVAQGSGVVEVSEGLADDGELLLASTTVASAASAKEVTATERRYLVEGDRLTIEMAMAAVGQPLTHHLRAHLTRQT